MSPFASRLGSLLLFGTTMALCSQSRASAGGVAESPHRIVAATNVSRVGDWERVEPPGVWAAVLSLGYGYRPAESLELGARLGYLRALESAPDIAQAALSVRGFSDLGAAGATEFGIGISAGPTVQTMHNVDDDTSWRRFVSLAATLCSDARIGLTESWSLQIAPEFSFGIPIALSGSKSEYYSAPWESYYAFGLSLGVVVAP